MQKTLNVAGEKVVVDYLFCSNGEYTVELTKSLRTATAPYVMIINGTEYPVTRMVFRKHKNGLFGPVSAHLVYNGRKYTSEKQVAEAILSA